MSGRGKNRGRNKGNGIARYYTRRVTKDLKDSGTVDTEGIGNMAAVVQAAEVSNKDGACTSVSDIVTQPELKAPDAAPGSQQTPPKDNDQRINQAANSVFTDSGPDTGPDMIVPPAALKAPDTVEDNNHGTDQPFTDSGPPNAEADDVLPAEFKAPQQTDSKPSGVQEIDPVESGVSTQTTQAGLAAEAGGDSLRNMEERLMAVLIKLDKKVDSISKTTKDIKEEFDLKLTQLRADLKGNTDKVAALETSVTYAHTDIEGHQQRITQLERDIHHLKEIVGTSQQQNKKVGEKLNEMERRGREYSIRLRGVPVPAVEVADHRIIVAAILVNNNLVGGMTAGDARKSMEIAHPLGKPIRGKINMIARFYARPYRNAVLRAAKQLGDGLKGAARITEDLTKIDADRKSRAYQQMQTAYMNGKKVKFHRGQLVIDGEVVEIDE